MGNFKNVFKLLRIKHGYTQDVLADMLGISRSAISMYENGNREPDLETLEKIADFFDVDIDYLLGRSAKSGNLPESSVHYVAPSCDELITVYTRSRKNLSQEEKMRLARIILSDDDEE